jgi:hypothetical protein
MNTPVKTNAYPAYCSHLKNAQDAIDMLLQAVEAMEYDYQLPNEMAMALQGVKDSNQRWRRILWDEEIAIDGLNTVEDVIEEEAPKVSEVIADTLSFLDSTEGSVDNTSTNTSTEDNNMSVLDTLTFYRDDKINGDARDIFKWIIQADPDTCDVDTFVHGMMLARVADANGKMKSLTRGELLDLCVARGFAGIPQKADGSLHKGNATKWVGGIVTRLKAQNSYDAKTVEKMTKHYPTAAFYPAEFIEDELGADFHIADQADGLDTLCADYCNDDSDLDDDDDLEDTVDAEEEEEQELPAEPRRQAPSINDAMARLGLK